MEQWKHNLRCFIGGFFGTVFLVPALLLIILVVLIAVAMAIASMIAAALIIIVVMIFPADGSGQRNFVWNWMVIGGNDDDIINFDISERDTDDPDGKTDQS